MAIGIDGLIDRARSAQRAAVAGDLSALGPTLQALAVSSDPAVCSWVGALRSELWLTEPRYGARYSPGWFVRFTSESEVTREGALVALANAARAAITAFDGEALAALEPLATALSRGSSREADFAARLVSNWAAFAAGAPRQVLEQASDLLRDASKADCPSVVVEAHAQRSLAATALGDDGQALELARRASLVGRSEGLPQLEFFVHLALSRARRCARQPHLALRILDALAAIAPKPWLPWIAWESLLAGGGLRDLSLSPASNAPAAVDALARALTGATSGDQSGFGAAALGARAATAGVVPFAVEALEALAAIDPRQTANTSALRDFRDGKSELTPASIHGLRVRPSEDAESAGAYVLVAPESRGVRLLHFGVALVDAPALVRVKQSQRTQGRVETLLAILALAGPAGLDETACFKQAYGFDFAPELHRGVFDVLLHRARATLEGSARLERSEGRIALHVRQPLLIPDPRVAQRTSDRVLRLLAERGAASAKDAAGALRVSLRTAQAALTELLGSGACGTRKAGRNVAYVVEDTVFSEPSQRLSASELSGLTPLDVVR